MNIIIYNVNSFGGNYDYSKELFKAYQRNADVDSVMLLSPNNVVAGSNDESIHVSDVPPYGNKLLRKIYFIYRSIVNPLRFYGFLKKQKPSIVIFNDYDQITSLVWSNKFKSLKKLHKFAVILHDPDRDKFLPVLSWSETTMAKVMEIMDAALTHGYLPEKPYYPAGLKKAVVPHGIFPAVKVNQKFVDDINAQRNQPYLLGIVGNIRDEKNYEFILDALTRLPNCQLLVAGGRASSNVPIEAYKKKIADLGLQDRVIWVERFLDEDELNAAISVCNIVLLYYKASFTSQSGILNIIASYRKKLVITDTPSALQQIAILHKLGVLVPPDDMPAFVSGVNQLTGMENDAFDKAWDSYIAIASWDKHVKIAVDTFKTIE